MSNPTPLAFRVWHGVPCYEDVSVPTDDESKLYVREGGKVLVHPTRRQAFESAINEGTIELQA